MSGTESYDENEKPESIRSKEEGVSNYSEDENKIIEHCLGHEMIKANYDIKKKIGGGGSGFVYHVVSRCDSSEYALKFVPTTNFEIAKREVEALVSLRHKNIMRYCCSWKIDLSGVTCPNVKEESNGSIGSCTSSCSSKSKAETSNSTTEGKDSFCIIFEDDRKVCPCDAYACLVIQTNLYTQNLKTMIGGNLFSMNDSERLNIFFDIVQGLEYIHSKGYLHRDLKPSNILLDKGNRAKIGDFGFAIKLKNKEAKGKSGRCSLTGDLGTKHYIAPEVVNSTEYDEKADIYSLGVILFEMFCKMDSEMERNKTLEMLGSKKLNKKAIKKIPEEYNSVRYVVKCLLEHDPLLRISLQFAIQRLKSQLTQCRHSNDSKQIKTADDRLTRLRKEDLVKYTKERPKSQLSLFRPFPTQIKTADFRLWLDEYSEDRSNSILLESPKGVFTRYHRL